MRPEKRAFFKKQIWVRNLNNNVNHVINYINFISNYHNHKLVPKFI